MPLPVSVPIRWSSVLGLFACIALAGVPAALRAQARGERASEVVKS